RQVAIVAIMHLVKNITTRAILAALGSTAFSATARVIYLCVPDAQTPNRKLFLKVRNTLATQQMPGLAYTFEMRDLQLTNGKAIHASVVSWWDEKIHLSADEALQAARGSGRNAGPARVMAWLKMTLSHGPRKRSEVEGEGKALGFSPKQMRTA